MVPDELHFSPMEGYQPSNYGQYRNIPDDVVSPISDTSSLHQPIFQDISTFEGYSLARPAQGSRRNRNNRTSGGVFAQGALSGPYGPSPSVHPATISAPVLPRMPVEVYSPAQPIPPARFIPSRKPVPTITDGRSLTPGPPLTTVSPISPLSFRSPQTPIQRAPSLPTSPISPASPIVPTPPAAQILPIIPAPLFKRSTTPSPPPPPVPAKDLIEKRLSILPRGSTGVKTSIAPKLFSVPETSIKPGAKPLLGASTTHRASITPRISIPPRGSVSTRPTVPPVIPTSTPEPISRPDIQVTEFYSPNRELNQSQTQGDTQQVDSSDDHLPQHSSSPNVSSSSFPPPRTGSQSPYPQMSPYPDASQRRPPPIAPISANPRYPSLGPKVMVRGPSRPKSIIQEWWLWEIAGIFLSLACFMAVIGVLLVLWDKPLSSWTQRISPNSLVSILTTIGKAALLYPIAECANQAKWIYYAKRGRRLDQFEKFQGAGRGPRGALIYLATMKGAAVLANFAAIVILLSLAIDPFIQQTIVYQSRMIAGKAVAEVGRVQNISKYSMENLSNEGPNVMSSVRSALFSGILDIPTSLNHMCPTGNCSWPKISSLGVCGKCSNVTSTITMDCQVTPDGLWKKCSYNLNSLSNWPVGNSSLTSLGTKTKFKTGTTFNTTAVRLHPTSLYDSYTIDDDDSSSDSIGLIRFVSVSFGSDLGEDGFPLPDVSECTLNWCERTYNNTTACDGKIEEATPETTNVQLSAWWGRFQKEDSNANSSAIYFGLNKHESLNNSINRNFSINYDTHAEISTLLQNTFTFDSTASRLGLNGLVLPSAFYQRRTKLDSFFKDIAMGLTNGLRNSNTATSVYGTSMAQQTYYHIGWGWLALPFILLFSTSFILVMTVFQTKKYNIQPWKSRELTLLFHPLQGWHESDFEIDGTSDMDMLARQMKVILTNNSSDRLRFLRT